MSIIIITLMTIVNIILNIIIIAATTITTLIMNRITTMLIMLLKLSMHFSGIHNGKEAGHERHGTDVYRRKWHCLERLGSIKKACPEQELLLLGMKSIHDDDDDDEDDDDNIKQIKI
ncbi:hypothetical protein ElyMa_005833200 [Elysia marginata]|uniref:Uncharacterized protein n=1 Tax=Elysia marginata TaxID=1093978 RepID=A0AAV4FZT4_9GAST|nr:hypothetical protein ElyMa_005833200 [Elysia marginata]